MKIASGFGEKRAISGMFDSLRPKLRMAQMSLNLVMTLLEDVISPEKFIDCQFDSIYNDYQKLMNPIFLIFHPFLFRVAATTSLVN